MKVTVYSLSEEAVENRDYRDALKIQVNGVMQVSFSDGEPEDANLSRDFNDVYSIPELMLMAYNAGKNGEDFIIENIEVDEL